MAGSTEAWQLSLHEWVAAAMSFRQELAAFASSSCYFFVGCCGHDGEGADAHLQNVPPQPGRSQPGSGALGSNFATLWSAGMLWLSTSSLVPVTSTRIQNASFPDIITSSDAACMRGSVRACHLCRLFVAAGGGDTATCARDHGDGAQHRRRRQHAAVTGKRHPRSGPVQC